MGVYFRRNIEMKEAVQASPHSVFTKPSLFRLGESGHRVHFCPRSAALQMDAVV